MKGGEQAMGLDNYKKCRVCKGIFLYSGYGPQMCPTCIKQDEEDFKKVKTYLRDNPGRSVTQTAEDCDVKIERIREWLREERLEFTDSHGADLKCERCGTSILSGTLCDECRQTLARSVGVMKRSMERAPTSDVIKPKESGNKMRFLNKR